MNRLLSDSHASLLLIRRRSIPTSCTVLKRSQVLSFYNRKRAELMDDITQKKIKKKQEFETEKKKFDDKTLTFHKCRNTRYHWPLLLDMFTRLQNTSRSNNNDNNIYHHLPPSSSSSSLHTIQEGGVQCSFNGLGEIDLSPSHACHAIIPYHAMPCHTTHL